MNKIVLSFIVVSFLIFNSHAQPTIQWQKSLGGTDTEKGYSVQLTPDGGFIIAGEAHSNDGDVTGVLGSGDYWIVKTDALGNIQWQKTYGGTLSETPYSIRTTPDGGYIVAGSATSSDGDVIGHHGTALNFDCWILKLDSSGDIQWKKCYGGNFSDLPNDIWVTTDGGYIFAGYTQSNEGDVSGLHGGEDLYHDYWVVRLDSGGTIQWQKCLGGYNIDFANCVQQTADGGFIVGGSAQSTDGDVTGNHSLGSDPDYWLIKLSGSGIVEWKKCYGGLSDDTFTSFQQTSDGGYILAGSSESEDGDVSGNHGSFDFWVIKTDAIGDIQWQKCLGGSLSEPARAVQQLSDGGYVIAGNTSSVDGDVSTHIGSDDLWIVKLSSSGALLWEKSLGGSDGDVAYAIKETTDGGCIVVGMSFSNDGDVTGHHGSNIAFDIWVVKLLSVVGIDEYQKTGNNLLISPDPFINEVHISAAEISHVEIFNTLGEKVFEERQSSTVQHLTLNLADFLPGIYFVTVTDKTGNKVAKEVMKM